MDTAILREILESYERFSEVAVSLDWKNTTVTHIEETKADSHQWAFITAVCFPTGYVQTHFAEAYVQASITHLGCTEEWGSDFYKEWTPEDRLLHLQSFLNEYTGYKLSLNEMQPQEVAQELTDHCKNPAVAESILPLLKEGKSFYLGWYSNSISWIYLTISGDNVMLITLSVAV